MASSDDPRARAQALLDQLSAAADLGASCERFGLLGHQVAEFAEASRERVRRDAEAFLVEQFDAVLATVSPRQKGEDASWRGTTARELASTAAREDLESALRDLSRLRSAVDCLRAGASAKRS
jgi:hypothetical protein